MRSVDEIRADLEHPYAAALLATGETSIGDGPIGRLLRDVGPLLEAREARTIFISDDSIGFIDVATRLVAAEAERDGAQQECAELWDALDAARMVIDEAQAKVRGRDQAKAAAAAAAAIAGPAPSYCGHTDAEGCTGHGDF